MSFATRSSVAATATALLALTTPFVQPPGCDSHFTLTNVPTYINNRDDVTSMISVLSSLPVASCYPSGWDTVMSQSRFRFSPAVCPHSWTYYEMAGLSSIPISTAFCCDSGYTLYEKSRENLNMEINGVQCIRSISDGGAIATVWSSGVISGSGSALTTGSDTTVMLHDAWWVEWAASDRSTLTPSIPDLTSFMLVPTWTPGESIPNGKYDRRDPSDDSWSFQDQEPGLFWFSIVGVPVLFVACVSPCVWCCVRKCKKTRRKKAAARDLINNEPPPAYTPK